MLRLRAALASVLIVSLAGCGGSGKTTDPNPPPPPPPPPAPANVKVVSTAPGNGCVVVHLHNDGGPGAFKISFYGLPTTPNGSDTFFGTTEGVEVAAGYDESPCYTVQTSPTDPPLSYLLVFSRDQGSAKYRQTDRYDVPG